VPVLLIYGIPPELTAHRERSDLRRFVFVELPKAVARIDELELYPDQVTPVPVPEMIEPIRREVVIHVVGLDRLPGRTTQVRSRLAGAIRDCAVEFLISRAPTVGKIEVILDPHYVSDGFAEWIRPPAESSEATQG
jgi:hypothetical protein